MAKSIIQQDKTRCFLCGRNGSFDTLDEHHVYEGPNKPISEKYGLKVYLHHNECHIFGKNSVHNNARVNKALKAVVQKRAMKHYGWSVEDFIDKFGKNYIQD